MASSRDELGQILARDVAAQLRAVIAENDQAILAVSGGSTPKPLFESLQNEPIDWSKIVVTLVDERWVPVSDSLSNERLVQELLLSNLPAAKFVSLYHAAESVEESLDAVLVDYCAVTNSPIDNPKPFDVVVLGMGGDGHTASFFPDAENISELVSFEQTKPLLICESPSTQVPRVTWSAPRLLDTSFLALHFCGADKWGVFIEAQQLGSIAELPIRVAIRGAAIRGAAIRGAADHKQNSPLRVYYAD